jgi:hypothetical protein
MHAICPTIVIFLDLMIPIYFTKSILYAASTCAILFFITSSLFGPNILSTPFSNNPSLCASLNVKDRIVQQLLLFSFKFSFTEIQLHVLSSVTVNVNVWLQKWQSSVEIINLKLLILSTKIETGKFNFTTRMVFMRTDLGTEYWLTQGSRNKARKSSRKITLHGVLIR